MGASFSVYVYAVYQISGEKYSETTSLESPEGERVSFRVHSSMQLSSARDAHTRSQVLMRKFWAQETELKNESI